MAAVSVAIAKQRMKPAVALAAGGEVVDQLDMAIAAAQRIDAIDLVEVEHRSHGRAAAARTDASAPPGRPGRKRRAAIGSSVWRTAIGVGSTSVCHSSRGSTGAGSR